MEFFNFLLVLPMEKRSLDSKKEQMWRNNSCGRLSMVFLFMFIIRQKVNVSEVWIVN